MMLLVVQDLGIYVLPDYAAAVGKLNLAPRTRGNSKRVDLLTCDWSKRLNSGSDVRPEYKSTHNLAQHLKFCVEVYSHRV